MAVSRAFSQAVPRRARRANARGHLPLVDAALEGCAASGAEGDLAEAELASGALEASGAHAQRAGGRLAVREGGEGRAGRAWRRLRDLGGTGGEAAADQLGERLAECLRGGVEVVVEGGRRTCVGPRTTFPSYATSCATRGTTTGGRYRNRYA